MSKLKIQGNTSGTGVITLVAPNTDTDRTITLPDESTTLGGVDGIVSTANATAITIDSSENVGIGYTTLTLGKLAIKQATDPGTIPAALHINTVGVGGGTATAQYGINVDCSESYNNSTSLHGIKVTANQNVGLTAYGIEAVAGVGNSNTIRYGVAGKSNFNSDAVHQLTGNLPVGVYGEADNGTGTTHGSTSAAGYFLNSSDKGANSYGVYINTTAGPTSVVPLRVDHGGSELLSIKSDGRGVSQFTARAWCNLNFVGTLSIRDSHNISSITDNGTGNVQFNFTNSMSNSQFVYFGIVPRAWGDKAMIAENTDSSDRTQSTSRAIIGTRDSTGGAYLDSPRVMIGVFGD